MLFCHKSIGQFTTRILLHLRKNQLFVSSLVKTKNMVCFEATGEPWCTPPHSGASETTQKALDIISWNCLKTTSSLLYLLITK